MVLESLIKYKYVSIFESFVSKYRLSLKKTILFVISNDSLCSCLFLYPKYNSSNTSFNSLYCYLYKNGNKHIKLFEWFCISEAVTTLSFWIVDNFIKFLYPS